MIGQFGRRAAATLAACARPARLETSPGRKAQSAALLGLGLLSCTRASKQVIDAQLTGAAAPSVAAASSGASPPSPSAAASASSAVVVAESIYDGGLRNGWQDWGWAPREVDRGGPARVRFNDWGGWIVAKPGLAGDYGGVAFRVKGPSAGATFLEVRLESGAGKLSRVRISGDHTKPAADGWTEVVVPMADLNPGGLPFDRVVLQAAQPMPAEWVLVDQIALTRAQAAPAVSFTRQNSKPSKLAIVCDARAAKISPRIYGIAGADEKETWRWQIGASGRRWGGNPTSTYNWELNVWNLGQDWFFENQTATPYAQFLAENAEHATMSALTVPMLGWVAKDATSSSFPVSVYGPQGKADPWRQDAGDGVGPSGAKLVAEPSRTSVAAPPDWVKRWVIKIRAADAQSGKRSVDEYILDNEPMLWSKTHRDLRHEPLGYDELLERTIAYGSAIREADPGAMIAGPAEWGWTNYFFSAKDGAAGFAAQPDRRAHGGVPLVEWYLRQLRDHEQKTGVRVIDVFDLHFYPQAANVYGPSGVDRETADLRLRSTRGLWDPNYVDESWIHDRIRLLPRMKEWVDANYPGLGISIGEWNFGAEGHISGALSIAEALGRFAQFGVYSAFYWTVPPSGAPANAGFAAYRNFDGKGARFLDWYLPTSADDGVSFFASRDDEGKHVVAIAINLSQDAARWASIEAAGCGPLASHQTFVYQRGQAGFVGGEPALDTIPGFDQMLPPFSITVFDIRLAKPLRPTGG